MADFQGQDGEFFVLDDAKHAIIADAIAPKPGKVAGKRFAETARVKVSRDAFLEKTEDCALRRRVKFFQLFRSANVELDLPLAAHFSKSSRGIVSFIVRKRSSAR